MSEDPDSDVLFTIIDMYIYPLHRTFRNIIDLLERNKVSVEKRLLLSTQRKGNKFLLY